MTDPFATRQTRAADHDCCNGRKLEADARIRISGLQVADMKESAKSRQQSGNREHYELYPGDVDARQIHGFLIRAHGDHAPAENCARQQQLPEYHDRNGEEQRWRQVDPR